jgi:hypothetical protein
MAHPSENPAVVNGGITFTVVALDFSRHQCIISEEALLSLAALRNSDFSLMEIFLAHEAKIRGVARRLIAAKVKSSPLQLEARSFH